MFRFRQVSEVFFSCGFGIFFEVFPYLPTADFPHSSEEEQEQNEQQSAGEGCRFGYEEYGVIYSVGCNRCKQDEGFVFERGTGRKTNQRVVIAHKHTETEMSGNGEQGTGNADRHIVVAVREKVEELYHEGYNYKIYPYLCTRKGIMLYIYEHSITIGNGQDVTKAI